MGSCCTCTRLIQRVKIYLINFNIFKTFLIKITILRKYRSSEYTEEQLSDLYFQEVVRLVENAEKVGRKICLFYAESLQSCGGQIVYPKNYLRKCYQ